MWAGVDVGGRRKGFHVALVDERRLRGLAHLSRPDAISAWLEERAPSVVAVDSPMVTAGEGAASRECERRLARAVCGIRYTPARARLTGNRYYEWIENGLRLYETLATGRWTVIECFPTASWTRWAGARGSRRRSTWTQDALGVLAVADLPRRLGQDGRDAIAAAATARAYERNETEFFGEIVVPR
jgi:predicted nuclease with RNAse H fold